MNSCWLNFQKMKPPIKIFIIISLLVVVNMISYISFAQKGNFKQAELQGKTWQLQGITDVTIVYIYETDKLSFYRNDKNIGNMEYYLSDSIVKIFDSSKVGKVYEGKYIIERPIRAKGCTTQPLAVSVLEIIELSPDRLIVRGANNPNLVEFKVK